MRRFVFHSLIFITVFTGPAFAQSTQPTLSIEARANMAFDRGEFTVALPLLKKLAVESRNNADKLGPIMERIRVCEKSTAGSTTAPSILTSPTERIAHPAPSPDEIRATTIQQLGNFDYDPERGGNIPPDVKQLIGLKVRVKGYMIPMDQAANVTQFALVPDLFACCFGQPPQVQHMILATCPPGKTVTYYSDELVVEGTLKVDEKKDDGFIVSVFEMDVTSVKPAVKD